MKQLDKLLLILLLCFGTLAFGQSKQIKKANEFYKLNRFSDAIPLYEQALKKRASTGVKTKLANCYRFLNKTEKAEALYAEIVQKDHINNKVYLYYGESLMSNAKYEEAKLWFQKYSELQPDDDMGPFYVKACEQVKYIQSYFTNMEVKPFTQNTEFDDTAPVFANNSIVFSSDRSQGMKILKQKSSMTGRDFIRVYSSVQNPDGTFEPAKPISNKINELNKNTGPITFTGDGKFAIFSCNAKEPNQQEIYPMQLFSAELEDGDKWKNIELLSVNRPGSNYMHPAISPDGNLLFFVSDKGNGMGGTDLYYTQKSENGWGKPQNLGPFINTSANEGFPFYSGDGKLYFSSKGHFGYGGYDVFYTEMDEKGRWKKPVNVGQPINSSQDDISIYVFDGEESGFFTSSRDGGDDDIFIFEKTTVQAAPEPDIAFLEIPDEHEEVISSTIEIPKEEPAVTEASKPTASTQNAPIPDPIKTEGANEIIEEPVYHINETPSSKATQIDGSITSTETDAVIDDELFGDELPTAKEDKNKPESAMMYAEQEEAFGDELITEQPIASVPNIAETNQNNERTQVEPSIDEPDTNTDVADTALADKLVSNEEEAFFIDSMEEESSAENNAIEPITTTTSEASENIENEMYTNESVQPEKTAFNADASNTTTTKPRFQVTEPQEKSVETVENQNVKVPSQTDVYEGEKTIIEPQLIEEILPADEIATPRTTNALSLNTYDDLEFALSENRVNNGQTFQLPDIHFPFNEFDHTITGDLAQELDKLAQVLRTYPELRIEIGGYSESYGEDQVNLLLSRQRAEAAMNYLVQTGIDKARLVSRGYGESKPLNHCVNGVLCSRAQHMENQRLEIKVLRQ